MEREKLKKARGPEDHRFILLEGWATVPAQEARMWAWLYQKTADFVLRTTFPEAGNGSLWHRPLGTFATVGCSPENCHEISIDMANSFSRKMIYKRWVMMGVLYLHGFAAETALHSKLPSVRARQPFTVLSIIHNKYYIYICVVFIYYGYHHYVYV